MHGSPDIRPPESTESVRIPPGDLGRGRHRLTTQAQVYVLLSVMTVLVLICAGIGAWLLNSTAEVSDRLVDRIAPARTSAARLQSALIDQETGVRGYLLTGAPAFLEPYTAGVATEQTEAAQITALVGDLPDLAADVAAIREAGAQWRRSYATPNIAAVQSGATPDEAQLDAGKRAFDRIRALFQTQNDHLDRARADSRDDLVRMRTLRDWAFTAMLILFVLTGLAFAVLFHLAVGRPLRALRAASRRVAWGDFGHHIPAQGPADLRDVAHDVEAMRGRIVEALNDSQEQRAVLTEQTAHLDAQTVELRRSNAELEQFAYVASHDLQEPLRKVASFCQMLERRYADKLDERGLTYISFAVDGAKRMQFLINDLLAFSRVGRVNDARVRVALDDALDAALANLAGRIEESDGRIERPRHLPEVVGDPNLLTMLWQNLVGNSVKFRHADRPPVVRVDCAPEPESGQWQLSVTDNGIGIGAGFTEKVFVIFQRLHTREAYEGTGIGLALCKKIVEFHGGRIWIDTGHTDGTCIRFTLPVSAPALPAGDGDGDGAVPAPALPDDGAVPAQEGDHPA
ncbi:sensor histidine kinase [Planotetraspora kaengkrachanensis]|nr:sensor histidine kinase [Planotetraspora kaengkrachanensis]